MKNYFVRSFQKRQLIVFFVISTFFLTYCEKKELPLNLLKTTEFDTLIKCNYYKGHIFDRGDYVIYEGDILVLKKNLKQDSKQAYVSGAENGYLISDYTRQNNLTVAIHASMPTTGDDNWRNEIAQAIDDWNSIPDSRIHFSLVTGSADITIYSDIDHGLSPVPDYLPLPDYAVAIASPPDGNNPGPTIFVNLDAGNNMVFSSGQKRYNMVHEIGHCIGLRHTNWWTFSYPFEEPEANQIPGTPETDDYSVMNGNTALNSWNGFSGYDIRALQVLYPACYYEQLGEAAWYNTNAVTSDNSWVYMVQNSRLYHVSPNDGSYTQLGGVYWSYTTAMTYLNSYIYIARNSRIYKVNPSNGTFTQLGGAYWANVNAMTSYNGWIYLVQNSRFYRVDPTNGSYTQLGGAWWTNTEAMASLGNWIYLVQNSRIYQVDPNNGDYGQLGDVGWSGTDAMTSLDGFLYVVQNSFLHKVDPTDGGYTILGFNVWGGTYGMTNLNSKLYLAQNSRFYSISFN